MKPDAYGKDSFRLRYLYPVAPGRDANMLNQFARGHWVTLALFHQDGQSAALFEVSFEGSSSKRTFTLVDGANLKKESGRWTLQNILNGGESTWPEIARHVNRIGRVSDVAIPRNAVIRTNAGCEFPLRGLEFMAVSSGATHGNWKFKDGVTEGVPFKEQLGPFTNTDLKKVPFETVFMISYGPS